ncbi:MAG TPA: outer membrane lipoprotein carrier protein LolA [Rhizomicrobium sp.]|nr:outer membrane lipoprotein carrier protein LolA [Rhizomicrobium sp.]
MRRLALALMVAVLAPIFMAPGQPVWHHVELSPADAAELDRLSAYLNGITTLKGGFLQISPNGEQSEGTFYISKPGRMRFEYKPPTPTLLVADGHTVAVANTRLHTIDRYPLSDTPLGVILNNDVDIRHNPALMGIEHQQGSLLVRLRSTANRTNSDITLVFTEPEFELRQWTVVDNQGLSTTVALRDQEPGAVLAPSLFILPDKNPFARNRQE